MEDLDYYFKTIYNFEYSILISFLIFILTFFILSNNLDVSAVLSAILQSLASLLAIITAFTLVAVQLSSQTYGSRILKMFLSPKLNKFFWLLTALYIMSMIMCIFILISIPISAGNSLLDFENLIKVDFIVLLAIWCFISLPAFITDTIKRLQPDTVINNLFEELKDVSIEFEDITKYDDYIIPIVDIITVSIHKGQIDTAKIGITKLSEYYSFLQINKLINSDNAEEILSYFLKHFKRASKAAIDSLDDLMLKNVIDNASKLGFFTIQKNISSFNVMVSYYNQLSKKMVEGEFEQSIGEILNYFENKFIWILIVATMKEPSDFNRTTYLLALMNCSNKLWEYSVEKNKVMLIEKIDNRMYYITKKLAWSGLFAPINSEIQFLTDFAVSNHEKYPPLLHCVIHKMATIFWNLDRKGTKPKTEDELERLNKLVLNILKSLSEIGLKSLKTDLYKFEFDYYISTPSYHKKQVISWIIEDMAKIALNYLKEDIYTKYDFDKDEINQTVIRCSLKYLEDIGFELINKKSNLIIDVINALDAIGYSRNLLKDQNTALYVLDSLEEIGNKLVEVESKDNVFECVKVLVFMGLFGIENSFSEVTVRSNTTFKKIILKIVCNKNLENDLIKILEVIQEIILELIEDGNEESAKIYLSIIMDVAKELSKKCSSSPSKKRIFESIELIKDMLKRKRMDKLFNELKEWETSLNPYTRSSHYYEFSKKKRGRRMDPYD